MDPTLLLFAHDYSDLVQRETDKDTCPSPYLASYVLYPIGDSEGYMKKYAREHHLRWVNLVNSASGEHFKKALNTRVTPEKWLCYIKILNALFAVLFMPSFLLSSFTSHLFTFVLKTRRRGTRVSCPCWECWACKTAICRS